MMSDIEDIYNFFTTEHIKHLEAKKEDGPKALD